MKEKEKNLGQQLVQRKVRLFLLDEILVMKGQGTVLGRILEILEITLELIPIIGEQSRAIDGANPSPILASQPLSQEDQSQVFIQRYRSGFESSSQSIKIPG